VIEMSDVDAPAATGPNQTIKQDAGIQSPRDSDDQTTFGV